MRTTSITLGLIFMLIAGFSQAAGLTSESIARSQDYEKTIDVKDFNKLDITIACELYLRQGDEESMRIEANKNILDRLEIGVRDSTLYMEAEHERDFDDWDVEVYLTVKQLKSIDIGGAVKLRTNGTLKGEKLELDISGAADLDMRIEVDKLLADFGGAVNAELEGRARYVVMDMSGASKVEADDLRTDAFYLEFSGFGKAEVYAEKVLKVDMSGMGVVRYGGNPKKVKTNSSGLGIIKAR